MISQFKVQKKRGDRENAEQLSRCAHSETGVHNFTSI